MRAAPRAFAGRTNWTNFARDILNARAGAYIAPQDVDKVNILTERLECLQDKEANLQTRELTYYVSDRRLQVTLTP